MDYLKSQLIKRLFNSDRVTVDRLISESILFQGLQGENDDYKPVGKKIRFPLGSSVKLNQNDRLIFILIISEIVFDGNRKHTQSSSSMLNTSLSKFWDTIKTEGGMAPISIPVFGSGLARINLSYLLLIQLIILSFVTYSKELRITEKLTIIVNKSNYHPSDFEELSKFLESIEI